MKGNDPPPVKFSRYKKQDSHFPRAEVDKIILNRL